MEEEKYELVGSELKYIKQKINTYYIEQGIHNEVNTVYNIDGYKLEGKSNRFLINSYAVINNISQSIDVFDIKFKKVSLDEVSRSNSLYVDDNSVQYDNSMKVTALGSFKFRERLYIGDVLSCLAIKHIVNTTYELNKDKGESLYINMNYESVESFTEQLEELNIPISQKRSKWNKRANKLKSKVEDIVQ